MLPFVVCNSLQALPHPTSVVADLSPILTLCLFDGSSEGIAGFLIGFRFRVPLLESGSSSLYFSADAACNPLLLVGVCAIEVGSLHTLRLESLKLFFQPLHKFLGNRL